MAEETNNPPETQEVASVPAAPNNVIVEISSHPENNAPAPPPPPPTNTTTPNTSNINPNRQFLYFAIFIILLPILMIYGALTRLFCFIIRERRFFALICAILLIIIPIIIVPVCLTMYRHYHHSHPPHPHTNDPVKVEPSNVTLYQFEVQSELLYYNASFALNIFNYHNSAPVDLNINVSVLYQNITLESVKFDTFSINFTQMQNLNFTLSGNNAYLESDSSNYVWLYLLIRIEQHFSTQSHTSNKADSYEVGCNVKVTKPPDGYMTAFYCAII